MRSKYHGILHTSHYGARNLAQSHIAYSILHVLAIVVVSKQIIFSNKAAKPAKAAKVAKVDYEY